MFGFEKKPAIPQERIAQAIGTDRGERLIAAQKELAYILQDKAGIRDEAKISELQNTIKELGG